MNRFLIIVVILVLAGCSSYRSMSELSQQEKSKIDDLLSSRKLCMVNEIETLDDGKTNIEYITGLVTWKCGKYAERIKDILYNDYKIQLGDAWSYSNSLREGANKEITEAILMRRKMQQQSDNKNNLLRKN
jgi:hypothetical protein